jgi:hypothetical protein
MCIRRKLTPLMTVLALVALAGCAPTTFVVSKDGYSTYFGRMNTGLSRRLCTSGDLRLILDAAAIPPIAKDGFYRHVCTEEYAWDTVVSIYTFLSPDEKKELMRAFAKFGYEVNLVRC